MIGLSKAGVWAAVFKAQVSRLVYPMPHGRRSELRSGKHQELHLLSRPDVHLHLHVRLRRH